MFLSDFRESFRKLYLGGSKWIFFNGRKEPGMLNDATVPGGTNRDGQSSRPKYRNRHLPCRCYLEACVLLSLNCPLTASRVIAKSCYFYMNVDIFMGGFNDKFKEFLKL